MQNWSWRGIDGTHLPIRWRMLHRNPPFPKAGSTWPLWSSQYHITSSAPSWPSRWGKAWLFQPPKVHFPHTFDSPTFCPKGLLSFGGKRPEESGKCLGLRSNYMGNKSNHMCLHLPGDRAGPWPSERLFCCPLSSRPCRSWCRIKTISVSL